jgi:hypothetical protein
MPKIVKSMKGEMVDFDILKIKQEMQSAPTPIEVSERKEFIDSKLQRKIRRAKDDIANAKMKRNDLVELKEKEEAEEKALLNKKPTKIKKVKKTND